MMKTMSVLMGVMLAAAVAVGGCAAPRTSAPTAPVEPAAPDNEPSGTANPDAEPAPQSGVAAWSRVVLTDAVTGERFRLSDLKGEPVLLHAFAVW